MIYLRECMLLSYKARIFPFSYRCLKFCSSHFLELEGGHDSCHIQHILPLRKNKPNQTKPTTTPPPQKKKKPNQNSKNPKPQLLKKKCLDCGYVHSYEWLLLSSHWQLYWDAGKKVVSFFLCSHHDTTEMLLCVGMKVERKKTKMSVKR